MGKFNHSPLPFEMGGKTIDEPGYGVIMDANGQDVAITEMGGEAETTFANAEFIVRAVNSHGRLLTALRQAESVLQEARNHYISMGLRPEGGSKAAPHSEWAALVKAIEAARAAIAKAEATNE